MKTLKSKTENLVPEILADYADVVKLEVFYYSIHQ
jgi:hypothetical protein